MLGAFCELYNAGLQQRIEAYQRQRKSLRYIDQASELKAVRLADERLAGYSYSAEQQILRRSTRRSPRSSAGSRPKPRLASRDFAAKAGSMAPRFGSQTA